MSIPIDDIAPIKHREAMALTQAENDRLLELITGLADAQWQAQTECTGWSTRDVVVHLIGSAHGQANPIEFVNQARRSRRLTKQVNGSHWVDGLNEAQLRDRADLTPDQLPAQWRKRSGSALKARRTMPAPVRALPVLPIGDALGTHIGWQPLRYLFDMGFTRDVWMHRVDIARATGAPMVLTPEHDGRIIADILAEWGRRHGQPFTLTLTGPAGGSFHAGSGGDEQTLDAVEFTRILSGRADGIGIMAYKLPL